VTLLLNKKQEPHPVGVMNQNLIIFALSFSDKPLKVSEIRKWIKEEAPKEYFGKIKVPIRESIHRNLNKLIDEGRVSRVIGNRYELGDTMGSTLAESLVAAMQNIMDNMRSINTIISISKTHPKDKFGKYKDEPILKRRLKEAMFVMSKLQTVAMPKLQNQIKSIDE